MVCLVFTGAIMATFTMLLHGGLSVGLLLQRKHQTGLTPFLLFYPAVLWLIPIIASTYFEVYGLGWAIYFHINLLLTIAASEICYTFRKENTINYWAFWLNMLSGSFMVLGLLFYHLGLK